WFDAAALDYVPSVTCVGHATVSTGADPRVHGVPGNRPFIFGKLQDPFTGMKPDACRIPTLADDWDSLTAGKAVIAVQGSTPRATVALAGHGAARAGGHKIVMAMYDEGRVGWTTNPSCYRLPLYLATISDSARLEARPTVWMGDTIRRGDEYARTSMFAGFQAAALLQIFRRENIGRDTIPDLLLVNFKTPDYVSHKYGPQSAQ